MMNMSLVHKQIAFKLSVALAASALLKINIIVIFVIWFLHDKYGFNIKQLFQTPASTESILSKPASEAKTAIDDDVVGNSVPGVTLMLEGAEREKDQMIAADVEPAHPAYIEAMTRYETLNSVLEVLEHKSK